MSVMGKFGRYLGRNLVTVEHKVGKSSIFDEVPSSGVGRAIKNTLFKETEANLANAYTGLQARLPTKGLIIGGAAAYAGFNSIKTAHQPIPGQVYHEGQAPMSTGDGIGRSNAPTLGANGSMVFGLNNMRRG